MYHVYAGYNRHTPATLCNPIAQTTHSARMAHLAALSPA